MSGKLIRAIALIFVIVFGAIFCGILWVGFSQEFYMIVPAVCFTGIYLWVLGCEVWGALWGYKKTVSTRITHWIKAYPLWGFLAMLTFAISMLALPIHFWPWK